MQSIKQGTMPQPPSTPARAGVVKLLHRCHLSRVSQASTSKAAKTGPWHCPIDRSEQSHPNAMLGSNHTPQTST